MSAPQAKLLVLVGDKFACIKIVGRATFGCSLDFKTVVDELQQKGYGYFVLDLSECTLMDSTFLGVLAGLGLKMSASSVDHCDQGLELLNSNPRITELLDSLGVLHLFKLTHGPLSVPDQTETHFHTPLHPSKEEVTRACLEAHQTLMDINPGNVPRFKEVAQFLAEDLKRLKNPRQ
jgi:anti-anti-sigma regulatory factor